MNPSPDIPLPKDPRHQRFADLLLQGIAAADAYKKAGFKAATAQSRATAASRLLKNVHISRYMAAIRAASATSTVLTVTEKREFLARVVRTDITTLSIDGDGKNGDMIKSYSINESESSRNIRLEKHDPLKAIDLDNRIAGEDPTANLLTELAQALQNLPKPAVSRL